MIFRKAFFDTWLFGPELGLYPSTPNLRWIIMPIPLKNLELSRYRCSTCTREHCPVWTTEDDKKLAQKGETVRTNVIVAVSESVGLCCHSAAYYLLGES